MWCAYQLCMCVVYAIISVTCTGCALEWCFPCQATWHAAITCKQFVQGDEQFKRWTKEFLYGQPNARKCPKCKVWTDVHCLVV